jgi:outer membrane protein assembly factor BamD (BamD/ComL family)
MILVLLVVCLALTGCSRKGSQPDAKHDLNAAYGEFDQKQYDKAFASAESYLKRNPSGPGSAEALYLQGRVHEARAEGAGANGRKEEARQELVDAANSYQRAISLQDPKPAPQVEGLCRAGLANAAYYLDDYQTAAREWSAALPLVTQSNAKAWILYRVGLCQQRLGSFETADQTFAQVQSQYASAAGGEPARRAATRAGHRGFYVQLGTFTSPVNADRAIAALQKGRVPAARGTDPATGRQIVRAGPVPSYPEAKALKQYLAGQYPDAVVVP